MQHRNVGVSPLLPAHKDATEAIQPTVGPFNDPASSFAAGGALDLYWVNTASTDVPREAELVDDAVDLGVVVALVQAEMLGALACRLLPFDRYAFDRLTRELEVRHVRAGDGEANRNASSIRQHAALGSPLGAVRWMWSGFFPLQAALSTSRHPSTASASSRQQSARSLPANTPMLARKRQPRSTRRNAGAPMNWNRCPLHSAHSTGSPFAARTELHSSPADPARAGYGNRADAPGAL